MVEGKNRVYSKYTKQNRGVPRFANTIWTASFDSSNITEKNRISGKTTWVHLLPS